MTEKPRTWTLVGQGRLGSPMVGGPELAMTAGPVRVIELEPVLDLLERVKDDFNYFKDYEGRKEIFRDVQALLREHNRRL